MDYRESPLLRGNPTQHPLWRAYRGWSDHGHDGATPLDAFVAGVAYGSTEAVTEAPEDVPLTDAQHIAQGQAVACPICYAQPGEPCKPENTAPGVHNARTAVAEAQQEAALTEAPMNAPIGLEVPCVTCGARRGERCIVIGPNSGWRAQPHYTRSADAQGKDLTAARPGPLERLFADGMNRTCPICKAAPGEPCTGTRPEAVHNGRLFPEGGTQ